MNHLDEQDDLWQLLGKAKKSGGSPFFAANVLRQVRNQGGAQQEIGETGVFSWLRLHWRVVSLSGTAALLLAVNAIQLFTPQKIATAPSAVLAQSLPAKVEDDEVIKDLDLLAYEENNIWLEDSGK